MKTFGMLLTVLLASAPVSAEPRGGGSDTYFPQQLSARDLMVHCASSSMTDRGRQRQRYCMGFVSGVEESMRLLLPRPAHESRVQLCIPAGTTARQYKDAYIRYARRPDSDLSEPAALVVVAALRAAYPCGEN